MSGVLRAKRVIKETPLPVRLCIVGRTLQAMKNGRIPPGTVPAIANEYGVSRQTIYRLHKKAVTSMANGCLDVSTARKKRCGRKAKYDPLVLQQDLENIPYSDRTTVRDAARALGIPHSSFHYQMKTQEFAKRHTNCLKPHLTEANKIARFEFAKNLVLNVKEGDIDPMMDVCHIDEKVFVITRKRQSFYVSPFEDVPERAVQNAQHPIQVMFVMVWARPRHCPITGDFFNGKIGAWAFVIQEPAKRNSKNRPKGTMETKSIKVTRAIYRDYLVNKVLPAIRQKWPLSFFPDTINGRDKSRTIWIQQDNCRVHVKPDDAEFVTAATRGGYDIRIRQQPANSPDLNVCDLGLFRAVDAIQLKIPKTTMSGLIEAIHAAYLQLEASKIHQCFLTLQSVISEVIVHEGGNHYMVPHINKSRLLKNDRLPENVKLTYLARYKLKKGHHSMPLFGPDDSDMDSSDEESVVAMESVSDPADNNDVAIPRIV